MKNKKIGIITSNGGHLFQIIQLKKILNKYHRFWVTKNAIDSDFYLKKEKVYYGYFPESRNLINFIKNFFLAFKILNKEKPKVLISSGAGIAVPFFIVGKIFFKTKLIFIEPYDFIRYPSLTGKIVYNFVDLFIILHPIQKKWYKKGVLIESLIF